MIKTLTIAVVALALSAGSSLAAGKQCRDAKGHFTKCTVAATTTAGKCRDKTTKKFAKCSAPNTEAVPAAKK